MTTFNQMADDELDADETEDHDDDTTEESDDADAEEPGPEE